MPAVEMLPPPESERLHAEDLGDELESGPPPGLLADLMTLVKPRIIVMSLVAVLVGSGLQAARLGNEAEALRLANEARFRSIFPADQRIVDLRAQLDQKLSGAGGGDASRGLLPLLGIVAEGLPAAPGLELRTIQFQGGELYLSLTGEDLQSLEKLRAWFAQRADARLEVQTANAGAEGVQIRVKVSSA